MKQWLLKNKHVLVVLAGIIGTALVVGLILFSFIQAKQSIQDSGQPSNGSDTNANAQSPNAQAPNGNNATGSQSNTQVEVVPPPAPTPPQVTGEPGHSQPAVDEQVVEINSKAYSPAVLTVKKGAKVIWINRDSDRHNVIADDFATDGLNGPVLEQNQAYIFTFTKTGEFPYHCGPHPSMQAKVIVTE